jgi:hypothetical protein
MPGPSASGSRKRSSAQSQRSCKREQGDRDLELWAFRRGAGLQRERDQPLLDPVVQVTLTRRRVSIRSSAEAGSGSRIVFTTAAPHSRSPITIGAPTPDRTPSRRASAAISPSAHP